MMITESMSSKSLVLRIYYDFIFPSYVAFVAYLLCFLLVVCTFADVGVACSSHNKSEMHPFSHAIDVISAMSRVFKHRLSIHS